MQSLLGLDRLELDDRTLDVSRLTELRPPIEDTLRDSVRWLWVQESILPLSPRELPTSASAQRECFPLAVLWTG